jgi:hypothetical protein
MRAMIRLALVAVVLSAAPLSAQFGDPDRVIPGGGIYVPGWTGLIDNQSRGQGRKLEDAKFVKEGDSFHITTGPATTFWNPANKASGDYVVKATFVEPKFMELNSHPHSYGIVIGGNDLGTTDQSYLYCAAYGDGTYIVRGFGPGPFQMNGPMGSRNPAVNKAPGVGRSVTQEIAWIVQGDKAECQINGTVVASYDRSELVKEGRLKSLDGVYGLRFTHNVEAIVGGFEMTKIPPRK